MSIIFAVVNQKGGVGKTTTSINLATALAAIEHRTLLIDLDSQGNASTGLGIGRAQRKTSACQMMLEQLAIETVISKTSIDLLDIVPATVELASVEVEIAMAENKEFILRRQLESIQDKYEYIVIDCPPALGLMTVNALACADSLIIPMQCEFFALEGLAHLLGTVEKIKRNLNPKLAIDGILFTMYDRRNKLTVEVETNVRGYLGEKVYKTIIPRNIKLSEAPSHGLPAILYDNRCSGSSAYIELAGEIVNRLLKKEE